MHTEKPYIKSEIYFDKVERFGVNYRPHLVPINFQYLMLGVQFDYIPQLPVSEKMNVKAWLIYNVDYSALINGTEFLIREGPHIVGRGKVIMINDFDFSDFLKFAEYLKYKISGNRKQSIDALHYFMEDVSKDERALSAFCIYLCKVLEALQFRYGSYNSTRTGHWFIPTLKEMLYKFFKPFIGQAFCEYNYSKWFCLYARLIKNEYSDYAENVSLCKQLLEISKYRDKELVSYYCTLQTHQLCYAIHELPIGYLGSKDPYEDLDLINELRQMLSVCYGENHSFDFSDIESEIKNYIKDKQIEKE